MLLLLLLLSTCDESGCEIMDEELFVRLIPLIYVVVVGVVDVAIDKPKGLLLLLLRLLFMLGLGIQMIALGATMTFMES